MVDSGGGRFHIWEEPSENRGKLYDSLPNQKHGAEVDVLSWSARESHRRVEIPSNRSRRRRSRSPGRIGRGQRRRRPDRRRRRDPARAAPWTPTPATWTRRKEVLPCQREPSRRRGVAGCGQRAPTAAEAAVGLRRIRSGSRRVDAKPGRGGRGEGEKRGGNDTPIRGDEGSGWVVARSTL